MEACRPLEGKVVVLACSELKTDALRTRLLPLGAEVIVFPAIQIRALDDDVSAREAVTRLASYDLLVLTSAHAVAHFGRLLETSGGGFPAHLRVCAIGPATAEAARAAGFPVHLVPARFVAEGVIEALLLDRQAAGIRVLLPRAREARDVLPEVLRQAGAHVDVVPVYENIAGTVPEETLESIRLRGADLLVFTSSSTVSNFVSMMGGEEGRGVLARTTVAVLGPVTAKTTESFGKLPEIVPPENTIPSLVSAIASYFSEPQRILRRDR